MALFTAFQSSVTGLLTNQTMLGVVGNNLANSNTTGFKSQRVDFQDLVYQNIREGSAPGNGIGGVNPMQTGFGAKVGSIESNFSQGPLTTTGRKLDLAVQGEGFFVVNNGLRNLYTRAGALNLDQNGYLVEAASGFRLQRFGPTGEATATTPAFQASGNPDIRIPLGVGVPGTPTNQIEIRGNLNAAMSVGDTYTSAIQVFDTQGTQHALSMTFTKTAVNTYSLDLTVSGGTVTGAPITGISFNADGTFAGPATAAISLAFPPGLPAAQPVTLQLGTVGTATGLSQFGGDSTAAAVQQNGSSAGTLVDYSFSQAGVVNGIFSNGVILPLAQIGLATFTNPGGLLRDGNNLYIEGGNSGVPLIEAATVGGRGRVQTGALEGSNVDVANELTQLVIAQRGFQINARALTASSETLQELANIVR